MHLKDDSRVKPQTGTTSIDAKRSFGNVTRQNVDHIVEKRFVESNHYDFVNKSISIQEALKIPEVQVAVHKTQGTCEKLQA